jgi:hypothetical protein
MTAPPSLANRSRRPLFAAGGCALLLAWVIVTNTATLQLPAGAYVLQVAYPGTDLIKQDPSARTFTVQAGQSLAYTFNLKLGQLLVEVDDARGQPIDPAQVTANAFLVAIPDTSFSSAYSANPADLPLQAGVHYNIQVRLPDGRQWSLGDQQVADGETRPVKVSLGDFK